MPVVSRAQRFAIELRIRCRPHGSGEWLEGVTLNISRSGVFFRLERLLPERTPVEMLVTLSPPTSGQMPEAVKCVGRIVRTEDAAQAATMDSHSFVFEQ